MPSIESTIERIMTAHAGQAYKPGIPYHVHLLGAYVRLCLRFPSAPDFIRHAALLHDAFEDTDLTPQALVDAGYDSRTIEIVHLVTHAPNDDTSYHARMQKLIASNNIGAMMVKWADMSFNADPANMRGLSPERVAHYQAKYAGPLSLLESALADVDI